MNGLSLLSNASYVPGVLITERQSLMSVAKKGKFHLGLEQ